MRLLVGANKATRLAARAAFIPTEARLVSGPTGGAVYIYEHDRSSNASAGSNAIVWYAIAFRGTAARSEFHHSYRSAEHRAAHIARFHESLTQSAERKAKRQADIAAWVNTYKQGDIFSTCWGYDQTNVDFYVVTRTSARCVWVRRIAADYEATGHMSGKTWPSMPIQMIGAETMHLASQNGITVNGHHASLENGHEHYTSSYA